MSDVILIYPNVSFTYTESLLLPLSALYAATYLDQMGYKVKIIDQRVKSDWRDQLHRELEKERPICVGISSLTGFQIKGGMEAASLVRQLSPKTPVIWGGVHPSLLPEQTLKDELVDAVVIGEGEQTFGELVKAVEQGDSLESVKGLGYKENGKLVFTPPREFLDLNQLPTLPYHLVNIEDYSHGPMQKVQRSLPIITSRGCPFRCGYCYNTHFSQKRWRALTSEKVVKNIESLVREFGIQSLFLLDDNFFVNVRRAREICQLLLREVPNIKLENVNCRADTIVKADMDFWHLVRQAGVSSLLVGVESGSNETLQRIHKDCTADKVLEANLKLKEANIKPVYAFMTGFPFERRNHVKETIKFMRRLLDDNPSCVVTRPVFFHPFPGTPLFDLCVAKGLKMPETLKDWITYIDDDKNYTGISRKDKSFAKKASIFGGFLDQKIIEEQLKNNPILLLLAKLYSKIVRFRTKYNFYSMMPELKIIKYLRKLKDKSIIKG